MAAGRLLVLAAALCLAAPALSAKSPPEPINLCMISGPPELATLPGVTVNDGDTMSLATAKSKLQGLSMDFVSAVFDQILGWKVNIVYKTGFSKTLYDTRVSNGCNVSVSSLFKSSRRESCTATCALPANASALGPEDYEPFTCCLDFSHTYFPGGWALMSKQAGSLTIDYIDVFFQRDIVHAICVAVIGVFVVAHLIWLFERSVYGTRSTLPLFYQFRPKYLDGLKDGTWFAGTTVLGDVGSGMKIPMTPPGRLLSIIWVMFGLFLMSFVTSVISSTLTSDKLRSKEIRTVADVAGKRVCMQTGFYEYIFDSSFPAVGIQKTTFDAKADCYQSLVDGKVDAVFGVREEFVHFFSLDDGARGKGLMVSPVIKNQEYAIAFADSWSYASDVNAAILSYREGALVEPLYQSMVDRWYSGDSTDVTYGSKVNTGNDWNWGLIGAAIAMAAIYLCLQIFVMAVAYTTKDIAPDVSMHGGKGGSVTAGSISRSKSIAHKMASKISSVHGDDADGAAPPARTASGMGSLRSQSVRGPNPALAENHGQLVDMLKMLHEDVARVKAQVASDPLDRSRSGTTAASPWVREPAGDDSTRGHVVVPMS